jgi:hypothetical protein
MNQQNAHNKQQLFAAISSQNMQSVKKILNKVESTLVTELLNEVLLQVDHANFVWFLEEYAGKERYQEAVADVSVVMSQQLIKSGFKAGSDFSLHPDGRLFMSKQANKYFVNNFLKKEDYTDISVVSNEQPSSMQILEKTLGVPFFDNLSKLAGNRLATMDNATASIYVLWLMQGISSRHPKIEKDFCDWLMFDVCGERLSDLASVEIEGIEFNGSVVFEDLLRALGETNVSIIKETDLSIEHLRLLDQVWTGENMRVSELIALLEEDTEEIDK